MLTIDERFESLTKILITGSSDILIWENLNTRIWVLIPLSTSTDNPNFWHHHCCQRSLNLQTHFYPTLHNNHVRSRQLWNWMENMTNIEIFSCNEEKKEMAVSIPTSTIDQVKTSSSKFSHPHPHQHHQNQNQNNHHHDHSHHAIFTNPHLSWKSSPSQKSPNSPPPPSAWSRRNHSERCKLSSESCRGRLVTSKSSQST